MRKKILGLIIVFISIFMIGSVSAETLECKYKLSKENTEISFKIVDGKINEKAIIKIKKTKNEEKIQNWDEALENTTYVGSTEFKSTKKCPEDIILAKSITGYNLFATNEASKESINNAIDKKYSTLYFRYAVPYVEGKNETTGEKEEIVPEEEKEYQEEYKQGCMQYKDKKTCTTNDYYSCVWNETPYGDYCNVDKLLYTKCGGSYDIPYQAPQIISFIINILKIATPIILIMFGIIILLKAMMSTSEDELKKAQKSLIKKIIAAVMVFFVVTIVQFVISKVADSTTNVSDCLNCFVNNDCSDSIYYKNNIMGTYMCKDVSGGDSYICPGQD